ncbi:MAG: deoxyhypusine synthase family protein [Candidatus Eisenbacteria bacterium]|nr:deoxyhypusine synthase family protein [Candidatus Eisenbacteria bacterium]
MAREFHDGKKDGLRPLEPLSVRRGGGLPRLLDGMAKTAFGGRELGEAYAVLKAMVDDPDCAVVVTLSGAMTVAKMGLVLCDMIEHGFAQMIVSTGAIMAHGLSEASRGVHYKHDPAIPDEQLFRWGYNRVYDTLEMEANLNEVERFARETFESLEWKGAVSSHGITRALGRRLLDEEMMPSVLGWACRQDVPVYVPAFTDSELGLDTATFALGLSGAAERAGDPDAFFADPPAFNPFLDLYDFARRILKAKRIGIFTIGGGVPRNWAQQVGPFVDIINHRLGTEIPVPRYRYALRICPEPVHWGGLSGCTYSEGVSWGKFFSREEGGMHAEVRSDATIAWPILIRALLEEKGLVEP